MKKAMSWIGPAKFREILTYRSMFRFWCLSGLQPPGILKQVFQACLVIVLVLGSSFSVAKASSLNIYAGYEFFDYKEQLEPPSKSEEIGHFFIFGGSYQFPVGDRGQGFDLRLHAELSPEVQTEYRGAELISGAPISDIDDHQYLTLGGDLLFSDQGDFAFFVGLRYRSWNRKLNYGTGYREFYQWLSLPAGFRFKVLERGALSILAEASLRPMLWGVVDVIFSETVVDGDDSSLTLGNRLGYRLELPLHLSVETRKLILTPYYEYSEIGESNTDYNSTESGSGPLGDILEPASRTHRVGLLFGFEF